MSMLIRRTLYDDWTITLVSQRLLEILRAGFSRAAPYQMRSCRLAINLATGIKGKLISRAGILVVWLRII